MMLQEQVAALHVGDEVVHQSGVKRKVVEIKRGRHVILKPGLRDGKRTAHINLPQFVATHSLPVKVKADPLAEEAASDAAYAELFFVVRALDHFHQKGMIPHCEPRIEAYFQLLETWLEDNDHASRD